MACRLDVEGVSGINVADDAAPALVLDAAPAFILDAAPALVLDAAPALVLDAAPAFILDAAPALILDAAPALVLDAAPALASDAGPTLVLDATVGQGREASSPDTGVGPALRTLTPAPLALWKFDEAVGAAAATDSSGNGNHAMLVGVDPLRAWQVGHVGGSILLSATGKQVPAVVVSPSASLDALGGAFTIAAWVKKDGPKGNGRRVVISRETGDEDADLFSLGFEGGRLDFRSARAGAVRADKSSTPLPGEWGHVAATYDGATLRLFVGATEVARLAKVGGTIAPASTQERAGRLIIGARAAEDGFVESMDGFIDDLRLYPRALEQDELKALAQ